MNPSRISLGSESFLLFPSACRTETVDEIINRYIEENLVFILPSIEEDFKIAAFKNKKPLIEYYSSAICAAHYLIEKMGLPLSEITFETPNGKIEIFNTGACKFTASIDRCKFLFAKEEEFQGCYIECVDVLLLRHIKAMISKDSESFSKDALKEILMQSVDVFATLACFSKSCDYFAFTPHRMEFTDFYAALLREYLSFLLGREDLHLGNNSLIFKFSPSNVRICANPITEYQN